jgi:hypothetical protein
VAVFISAVDLLDTYNISMWCPTRRAAAPTTTSFPTRRISLQRSLCIAVRLAEVSIRNVKMCLGIGCVSARRDGRYSYHDLMT